MSFKRTCALLCTATLCSSPAAADENLFGYVKGSETLPEGAWELYQIVTNRRDKSVGHYSAWDSLTELEYGVTDSFNVNAAVLGRSIDTSGLMIDGYLPGDKDSGLKFAGLELGAKYNFLAPALNDFGLTGYWELDYSNTDPHSGQDKDTLSFGSLLIMQKYFMEGQIVWAGNLGLEATWAKRGPIDGLPADFEWPTDPEMEIELLAGTAITYRFVPNWYLGAEIVYETEFETEVGQERWSVFAGPTLHYGSQKWWATFTWFPQLRGGGESFEGQDPDLHLIEKTETEYRFKLGFNF